MKELKEYRSINITTRSIEDYFSKHGMNVRAHIESDVIRDRVIVTINPMMTLQISITNELLEDNSKDSEYIESMLDDAVHNLQVTYYKVFNLGKNKIIASDEVDKYFIIYNPQQIDSDVIYKTVVALEL